TDGRAIVPPYVAQAAGDTGDEPTTEPAEPEAAPAPAPDPAPDSAAPEPDGAATDPADAAPDEPASVRAFLRAAVWLLVALVVGGAAAGPAAWRTRLRRRRLTAVDAGGPEAADAAWAELLAESTDQGSPEVVT